MNNPQQRQPFQDIRNGFNLLHHAVDGYATAILPFLRRDFGTAFFGFNTLVAVIIMMLSGAMENSDDLLTYMFVWIILVTAHRLDAHAAYRKGRIIHSRYSGDSWMGRKIIGSKARRKTIQMVVEPMTCFVAGALICPHSQAVGSFLIVGGFALMISNALQRAYMDRRVRQMRDSYIEQQATSRMFRDVNEDD